MSKMYNPDTQPSVPVPVSEHIWQIEAEQVGTRLDRYLTTMLSTISRSMIQQLIAEKAVFVNKKPGKSGYALRLHDEVQVLRVVNSSNLQDVKPLEHPLDVLYEDEDLLIINKDAGMVVHPAIGHYEDTLVNALVARYPDIQEIEGDIRPGIVHRLDRDTSGLIIVAKNVRTQAALIEMMKQHQVEKRYLALVEGVLGLDKGSIDAPIGRDPRHRQQMTITPIDSREARTHFKVVERFARHTLLLLQLETGRTHQIRVHLKGIGHSVVADPMYGSGRKLTGIILQRQFLHAYQLRFNHPTTGKLIEVEAPLPADLRVVLDKPDTL